MADVKKWIYKNNRISGLLISIALSAVLVLLAIYVQYYIVFLIPVVTFFSFHYVKLYKFLPRLYGSIIVFIVASMIASTMACNIEYHAQPTYEA